MRVAVVDDEPLISSIVADMVSKWAQSRSVDIELQRFESAESFMFSYDASEEYGIILLDVEMKGQNGIEMAKQLRDMNCRSQIIFVTGYTEYISEGYDVNALHYLIKPVSEKKLYEVLDKASEMVSVEEKRLYIKCDDESVLLPLSSIKYISVSQNYITVHADKDYMLRMTLSEVFTKLDGRFYKIGRSLVVNLNDIVKVTKEFVYLKNNVILEIPASQYDGLNRAIIKYL